MGTQTESWKARTHTRQPPHTVLITVPLGCTYIPTIISTQLHTGFVVFWCWSWLSFCFFSDILGWYFWYSILFLFFWFSIWLYITVFFLFNSTEFLFLLITKFISISVFWCLTWLSSFSCDISVAPDAIHNHVKTCRGEAKNMYYIAPEYASKFSSMISTFYTVYMLILMFYSVFTHLYNNLYILYCLYVDTHRFFSVFTHFS